MRRSVAILCSGQGGQHSRMFDLFADCPEAEPVFVAVLEGEKGHHDQVGDGAVGEKSYTEETNRRMERTDHDIRVNA